MLRSRKYSLIFKFNKSHHFIACLFIYVNIHMHTHCHAEGIKLDDWVWMVWGHVEGTK